MKCINNIPGYNKRIRAPSMQFDIDRGIEESPKMTEKEMKVEQLLSVAPLKKKHPASIQTEWSDDKGYTDFKDTPQAPGHFAYEKASPSTKRLADFTSENGFNYRINSDGSITVEMAMSKTDDVKRVKVYTMKQLRELLGY